MATKTTLNSKTITQGLQDLFDSFLNSRVKISGKHGREYLNISLLLTVIIGFIFPVALGVVILLSLVAGIQISILQEEKKEDTAAQTIELK
ncbi:hypothetical protein HX021_13875 [Sphingobacterium sp. N143]|uniref:hypothetical protein n=1 Tax=Sphingobacterium sp. N143 TaxID=2746727 RepID=UPI00257898EC|nr:hypothetical protein [Sphingobacterium sp. N143]MDM1295372.1 hypothetical protein [Sphingobacterium sp. N143]